MKRSMLVMVAFVGSVAVLPAVPGAAAQVAPPAPPTPRTEPTPAPPPVPRRGPRALPPLDQLPLEPPTFRLQQLRDELEMRNHDLQLHAEELQEHLQERQREQEWQLRDRTRDMEDRQLELQDRMRDHQLEAETRQLELQERVRERAFERAFDHAFDMTTPIAPMFIEPMHIEPMHIEPVPMAAPLAPLPPFEPTPRAVRDGAWVPADLDGAFLNRRPREAWAQGDPADSLYRAARESLNRGEYRRAAQLFNEVTKRFPNSAYAYASGYWEAYSRYRIGTTDELKAADRALQALASRSAPSGRDDTDVNGLRTRIRGALAVRGDEGSAADVETKARGAGSSCDREDLLVRVEALNALSQMDAAAALPILRRVLERKDECLVELRRRAVFMLARRGDAEATNLLIGTAKNDVSVDVRVAAIEYLPRMAGDAGLTALEEILRTAEDERVQRAAVRALLSSDNPRARASLRSLIERKDASETLRMQAIEAYGTKERSTPEDAAYLRALYGKVDNERMKSAILRTVARIGGKENLDWLAGIVRNQNETSQIRSMALQSLSRSDVPVADLGRMYESADSRTMREQLIAALANRKEPEATDKLIEIAKSGTDPDMRRLAINYLSRKNDPRTTKLLMELIEK